MKKYILCKECCYPNPNPNDIKERYCPIHKKLKKGQFEIKIELTFDERMKLAQHPAHCPNCDRTDKFKPELIDQEIYQKIPHHPFQKGRAIYKCTSCGFFTDIFDGWTWTYRGD